MKRAFLSGLLLSVVSYRAGGQERDREWRFYGHDAASTKYSPLDQIDASDVGELGVVWRWKSPDEALVAKNPWLHTNLFEGTPILLDGVLYVSTSLHQVAAIDAATGRTLWTYDPGVHLSGPPVSMGFTHRGVSAWGEGIERRIFHATGDAYLIALDASSGEPVGSFGKEGRVDLTLDLRRPVDRRYYGVNSPPLVVGDVVVAGSIILDPWPYQEGFPGDVRGFDARTGKLLWTFHTVPQKGEVGYESWLDGSAERAGQANVWTTMSADEELGYVYLPLSTPTNDDYGGHRPGDNLFGESVVCVEARTGRRIWHFQAVHHGLWDYDLPAAPVLADIVVEGKPIKALAQVSKQAFVYVLDRTTGEPVWPIEERPVPPSTVPGEKASPTQPFPTRPAPFDRQGLSEEDLIDFTPQLRLEARAIVSFFDTGPLFTPPTQKGLIVVPGRIGGASWAGAAYDPETHVLYVPSVTLPYIVRLVESKTGDATYMNEVLRQQIGPQGLPLTKPPYGRITAIDLDTGEHLWMMAHGSGPRDHPALKHVDLPPLGWNSRGFVVVTKTLLFSAQGPRVVQIAGPRLNSGELHATTREPMFRALDKKSGELLFEIELPANAGGAPMTYEVGRRQFIVVPVGGGGIPAELVALALP